MLLPSISIKLILKQASLQGHFASQEILYVKRATFMASAANKDSLNNTEKYPPQKQQQQEQEPDTTSGYINAVKSVQIVTPTRFS